MFISDVTRWVGYLEHKSPQLLGIPTANVGKGGYTIFAQMIWDTQHINLMGLPWCAVFVHAVINRPDLLGRAHPGTKVLYRRMRRRGFLRDKTYIPTLGDLVFCANDGQNIDHVGIVLSCDDDWVTSIDGNSVDPFKYFNEKQGGAVSVRRRWVTDKRIIAYAAIGKELNLVE